MDACLSKRVSVLTVLVACSLTGAAAHGGIVVSAVVNAEIINFGQFPQVTVDVFVTHTGTLDDLWGYSLFLDVTGGDAGTLDVYSSIVNQNDPDFVFNGFPIIECTPFPFPHVCIIKTVPPGVFVDNPGFLGTFRLAASADAEGEFEIRVRPFNGGTGTVLIDSTAHNYTFSIGAAATIQAGVECLNNIDCSAGALYCLDGECVACVTDADCDDGNQCTLETCNQTYNVCLPNGNEPAGTRCDDGLFCTRTDQCDGAGSCVGANTPCTQAPFLECCEPSNSCLDPNGSIFCPEL